LSDIDLHGIVATSCNEEEGKVSKLIVNITRLEYVMYFDKLNDATWKRASLHYRCMRVCVDKNIGFRLLGLTMTNLTNTRNVD